MQSVAILQFYRSLRPNFSLPAGVEVMNPFQEPGAWRVAQEFYKKFYSDSDSRLYIFGINPGRFGGGVTGVPFTDPIRLESACGIKSDLAKKPELSSDFIYRMIDAFGGVTAFYGKYFITALSPLGFTRNGLNLNYYDDKELLRDVRPFIVACIKKQMKLVSTNRAKCYCLGEGTNFQIFQKLNAEHRFFEEIVPLPHPRWIMQYRRKKMEEYIRMYVDAFKD